MNPIQRKPFLSIILISLMLAAGGLRAADDQPTVPDGGVSLLGSADPIDSMGFYSGTVAGGPIATRSVVDVQDQSFTRAFRIDVGHPGSNYWDAAMNVSSTAAVQTGDVALVHCFIRKIESSDESGLVSMTVYVQGPAPDYSKSLSITVSAGDEWTELFLPFKFDDAYAAGAVQLNFGVGQTGKPMIMEIGGIELLNYGKTLTLEQMPRTRITYAGVELDAAWRTDAAARIEQYRKGDLTIRVIDAEGTPVPNAAVKVEMLRHHFKFSTAVTAASLTGRNLDDFTYRAKILELFNAVGTENDLKWPPWEGDWGSGYNKEQTLQALQWIQDNDLDVRGHVLVWPGERNLPNSIKNLLPSRDSRIPQMVLDHIDEITTATRDFVQEWDVINEPYDNHDLMDIFGREVMVDWFKQARKNLPQGELYLNDYSILSSRGRDTDHQQHFEDTIRYLIDNDAPITGIGFQGHFGEAATEPTKLWEVLERYANAFPDLKFKITEFDIDTTDREYQANYTRDFITMIFSHPQSVGLQFWGFWEGRHWRPESSMYTEDWQERPFGAVYRDLVFSQWWNDLEGQAGENGRFNGRTFYGRHLVTAEIDGQTVSTEIEFIPGRNAFKVRLATALNSSLPAITRQPLSQRTEPGGVAHFAVQAGDPAATYQWYHDGVPVGDNSAALEIKNASSDHAGTYWVDVTGPQGTVSSRQTVLAVKARPYDGDRLVNISTRGQVLAGAKVMIAGFVLAGSESKEVLLRAVGPTLADFGVEGSLADPVLDLVQLTTGGEQKIARNEAWESGQDPAVIAKTSTRVGAFQLASGTLDAVVHVNLAPGAYTASVAGRNGQTGVSLVEVYDADDTATGLPLGQVVNISTRGEVGLDAQVLIAGFVVTGDAPKQVLIRGVGPGLAAFGVPGTLVDPQITLFKKMPGSTDEEVGRNDDWGEAPDVMALTQATSAAGAFGLDEGSWDAALLVWLEPGVYTAQVSGAESGTGVALVEVYPVD